jgi:transposase
VSLAAKRRRDDEEEQAIAASGKRRRRTPSVETMTDEQRLLIKLKDEDALPWKEIAARFSHETGAPVNVAALQMRHLRLRESLRPWEPVDFEALRAAHAYWEDKKWEIISQKVCNTNILRPM